MSKTSVDLRFSTYLKDVVWHGFTWRIHLLTGRLYTNISQALSKAGRDYINFSENSNRKYAGPLNEDQLSAITDYQVEKVNTEDAKRRSQVVFTDSMLARPLEELSMQLKGTRLLYEALKRFEADVKTVANIGARVDATSSYLAAKFPSIRFISVDLQNDLEDANRFLPQSDNWVFESGYALDLLKNGTINPDAVYMTSTSVLFNATELDAYLDEMAKGVKLIVLNEPWWPKIKSLNIFAVCKPESVPIDTPYCAGKHASFHHNYIDKLEQRGYQIASSTMVAGYKQSCALQIVARKF